MLEFKYDTQLLIEGENLDENKISEYFTNNFNGDCLLAVGDEELIKIHFHIYKAIIEAVPDENDSMMIWLDDFNFPQAEIEDIKKEIELYFKARNITCIFKAGKRA